MSFEMENVSKWKLENIPNYSKMNPEDLIFLFIKYAPNASKQRKAQFIFKELTKYLTKKENKRLFEAWEDILIDPGKFFSVIHYLEIKFSIGDKNTFL